MTAIYNFVLCTLCLSVLLCYCREPWPSMTCTPPPRLSWPQYTVSTRPTPWQRRCPSNCSPNASTTTHRPSPVTWPLPPVTWPIRCRLPQVMWPPTQVTWPRHQVTWPRPWLTLDSNHPVKHRVIRHYQKLSLILKTATMWRWPMGTPPYYCINQYNWTASHPVDAFHLNLETQGRQCILQRQVGGQGHLWRSSVKVTGQGHPSRL